MSRLKNPSELTIPLEAGAAPRRSSTPAETHRALGAALILAHGAGAGQRSTFMVDFARALVRARRRHRSPSTFLYTEQGRRIPDRAPVLEACYRAVIDFGARAQLASARSALVHRRQVDGRANRDAGRGRGSDAADRRPGAARLSAAPAGQSDRAPRQAPAGGRPADAVRAGGARRLRHAGGARADRRARIGRRRRSTWWPEAITPSSSPRKDPAAQAAVYDERSAHIVEWVRMKTIQLHDVTARARIRGVR